MNKKQRIYGFGIWGLGLGYFLFYTPYSGLTRALSNGILTSAHRPLRGTVLLPVSVTAVAAGMLGFITVMKWWKYAGHRGFLGISIPFPRRLTFLSGVCMSIIMGTTTLAFALEGVSIVLVLVLLRGGVLIIAPLVDSIVGRRVRWFCWVAMLVSLIAVLVVLGDTTNYKMGLTAMITIAAYLAAYFIRFQLMSALAKTKIFPGLSIDMIEVGESTGALPQMLASVAEFYEDDVNTRMAASLSMIEPAIMIFMGGFVAFVLVALYLPIFSLAETLR